MTLELMQPTRTWSADAHEDTVDALGALAADEGVTIRLWCRDDCPDCRRELPDFAAAVEAAGFPRDRLAVHEVDGDNDGPLTEAYGVERIPTILVERDGTALARFVEREALPAPQYLAGELS
jgi:thiol-disulfide isomerase/thioredoxin